MEPRNPTAAPPAEASRRRARRAATVLLAVVVLSAIGLALFDDFVNGFEEPTPPLPAHVDVIVVLSGGPGRLDEGLRLLLEERAPLLFLVGFKPRAVASRLGQDAAAADLARDGRIAVEPASRSTLDDARLTRTLVERRGARSVLLITSAYHVKRADLTFREVLPSAVTLHVRPVHTPAFLSDGWFDDETSRRLVLGEFVKYVLYRAWFAVS